MELGKDFIEGFLIGEETIGSGNEILEGFVWLLDEDLWRWCPLGRLMEDIGDEQPEAVFL